MQSKHNKYWDTREELDAIHGEIESLNQLLQQLKQNESPVVNPIVPNTEGLTEKEIIDMKLPPMFTAEDFRDIGDMELCTMLKDLASDVESNGLSVSGTDRSYLIQTIRVASERLLRASTRHSNLSNLVFNPNKFNTDGA